MAKMLPYPPEYSSMTPTEELLYNQFADCLGSEYTVFYGCRWKNVSDDGDPDVECDFIITKLNSGILVLEVKGGRWDMKEGVWYCYGKRIPPDKNPFIQASDHKYKLLPFLKLDSRWEREWFPVDEAVALPETRLVKDIPGIAEVLTEDEMGNILVWVERTLDICVKNNHGRTTNQPMMDYLLKKLMPDSAPRLTDILKKDDERLLGFSQKQLELGRNLSNMRHLTVHSLKNI